MITWFIIICPNGGQTVKSLKWTHSALQMCMGLCSHKYSFMAAICPGWLRSVGECALPNCKCQIQVPQSDSTFEDMLEKQFCSRKVQVGPSWTSRICCFCLLSSWSCPSLICLVILCCQIISQTLSPTWNQCLPMSHLLLSGDLQYIQREPPHILIEVYDDDALVIPNSNKRLNQVI